MFGTEICIWRVIEFEAWGEQSKMAGDDAIAKDFLFVQAS